MPLSRLGDQQVKIILHPVRNEAVDPRSMAVLYNSRLQCWDLIVVGFARIPQHTKTWGILGNPTTQNRVASTTKRGVGSLWTGRDQGPRAVSIGRVT